MKRWVQIKETWNLDGESLYTVVVYTSQPMEFDYILFMEK
jgi:hypothetical protein